MYAEDKLFWTLIASIIISCIIIVCVYSYEKDVKMAELGYQRVSIVGQSDTVFQKACQ